MIIDILLCGMMCTKRIIDLYDKLIEKINKKDEVILCNSRPKKLNLDFNPYFVNFRTYREYSYYFSHMNINNIFEDSEDKNIMGEANWNNIICDNNKRIISNSDIVYPKLTMFSTGMKRHPASMPLIKHALRETKEHEIMHVFINASAIHCINEFAFSKKLNCNEIQELYDNKLPRISYIQNIFDEIDKELY